MTGRTGMEYPHLRGAAVERLTTVTLNPGISPPAWGSRLRYRVYLISLRNIPTCVGQPFRLS